MSILIFIVVILVLVLAHEFGHFIIAKRAGIRVDEFAFGFPPRLWKKKFGETTYSFNLLPIGGYVKIYGENPNDVGEGSDAARSFTRQSKWIQGFVITGGVIFNLLLAWILISSTFMIGIPASPDAVPGYVVKNEHIMITGVHEKSPALESGVHPGDALLRIQDGEDSIVPTSPEEATNFISTREGHPLVMTFEHSGVKEEKTITPVSGVIPEHPAIGIYMDVVGTLQLPFHVALWEGLKKTALYTELTASGIAQFLSKIVTGHSDFSQVTGPVGIVQAVGDAATSGITNLILFTALISINLAVINVLPFPALDGGRLLFIVIEGVTRKQIKTSVTNLLNVIGFALLMLLMIVVTYHDIAKLTH